MSRIGNRVLEIPAGVSISLEKDILKISGTHGVIELNPHSNLLNFSLNDNKVVIKRNNEEKFTKMIHGTTNSNINNAIIGVSKGHSKKLKIIGVGYKAAIVGNHLELYLGHSHNIKLEIPKDIKVTCTTPTEIEIFGSNKTVVGEFASIIRSKRPPEPYKGKGVMYHDEHIIRKVGKTADGGKK
ncbi:MAG: 50S ribosomal protein L6 [Mycoplasmoidaceae bacterium]